MNKLKKIGRIIRTISYLKPIQIVYQIKNRLIKTKTLDKYELPVSKSIDLQFFSTDEAFELLIVSNEEYRFTFLNLQKSFIKDIDWNYSEYGKLWNYNLQYLDYLKQEKLAIEHKLKLIHSLYLNLINGNLKLEPYPASLRIMNLIRFVCSNDLSESERNKIQKYIRAEANYLHHNLEYHLLANHLLENLFAMNMAAYYFDEQKLIIKYQKLIILHLNEQILKDGAHYEVSPMYHKIIFFRVLELYCYLPEGSAYKSFVNTKLSAMLSWLEAMTFANGESPDFNDSTSGITYSFAYFKQLCRDLAISSSSVKLSDSGYRKFAAGDFELIIDVNGIAPSYQPGHAHADTFSFCMNYQNQAIIVDPGISTYNISARRNWERSTETHNTVSVNGQNSAEVWSGFRVGRRLQVQILKEDNCSISAKHNGYRYLGSEHKRTLSLAADEISLLDELQCKNNPESIFNLHFHPDVRLEITDVGVTINKKLLLAYDSRTAKISQYDYCMGYNRFRKAPKLKIILKNNRLQTTIKAV